MIKQFLFVVSVSMYGQILAQQDSASCIGTILTYNKKMVQMGKPKKGQTYLLDYRQEMNYWDSNTQNVDVNVKYYASESQVHVISKDLKSYMDDTYLFTVIEGQKKVIVTRNPSSETDPSAISNFLKNQEAIIKKCTVLECTIDKSKGIRKISLDGTNTEISGFEAEELTYFFKHSTGDLKKTITTYSRRYPVRRMSITINEFNTNANYKFPKKLYDKFLDEYGKLKGAYKGYQLIIE